MNRKFTLALAVLAVALTASSYSMPVDDLFPTVEEDEMRSSTSLTVNKRDQTLTDKQVLQTMKSMPPNILQAVLKAATSSAMKNNCPKNWPQEMCNLSPSFYVWMKQLKKEELEREIARNAKAILQKVIIQAMLRNQ